jgi:hypothetical protein
MSRVMRSSGISSKNVRQVEQNLARWLVTRPLTEEQRFVRNKTVGHVRNLIRGWRASLRRERRAHKRHLRSERAKQRRAGR